MERCILWAIDRSIDRRAGVKDLASAIGIARHHHAYGSPMRAFGQSKRPWFRPMAHGGTFLREDTSTPLPEASNSTDDNFRTLVNR
jgi:hypothetical protein